MNSSEDYFGNDSFALVNWTHLDDDMEEEEIVNKRSLLQIIYCFLVLALFIVGVPVNLMICVIVARTRKLQTTVNMFLVNLTIADTFMILKIALLTSAEELFNKWIFGKFMCTFVIYTISLCSYFESITVSSTFMLFLFYPRINMRNTWTVILLLWIVSSVVAIPRGYYAKVYENEAYNKAYCAVDYQIDAVFQAMSSAVRFFLPIINAAGFITFNIGYYIHRKKFLVYSKTNLMLFLLLVIFLISTSPYSMIRVIINFELPFEYSYRMFMIAHYLSISRLVYKPFLYIFLADDFKNETNKLIQRLLGRSNDEDYALYTNETD